MFTEYNDGCGDVWPLSEVERKRIDTNMSTLDKLIKLEDNNFLDILRDKFVSEQQLECILRRNTEIQVEMLLDLMRRKSAAVFKKFIACCSPEVQQIFKYDCG